ncbi:efflux RND transporter periplasmic adaptor subunit [Flavitalea sp. BT771]|uniref:efflux RND transporter periplasmic adaptor subunit n=1 Tax=Flavitalea sp. BT771 TaxID=3063329 RepID=UPI0026E1B5B0|nr:efflux RND transporter periplasmic adaptor subunit [Flavitalea sp. BT771]MDO6434085.1 efflux RND transporter periplasmic adaptor subunit [Flavitalea sp. BT771]MDV6222985.1 efflux RND transporter periplasmic adaptor subunit [Flavitalea sp. BT771]
MNKKALWIILGIVILVIGLVGLKKAGVIGKDEGTKVSAEKVARRNITEIVTASGKIYPEKEVKISPDISGEVVELNVVQEGDSVKKGQELARIYADIYTTQRDQAAAQMNQQQALVSNVSATLPGLKTAMETTQRTLDRQKQLLDQKVISQSEYEAAESAYRTAEANYMAALQTARGNVAGVASARANLSIAAKNLSRTTVVSPIDGVVSLLSIKKGERVVGNSMMAGTEMMRVADMSRIEAIVDVGENDIPKVHLGDSALLEVDAYSTRKFKGIVTQIASSVTTASGATTTVSTNDVTNYKVHIRLSPDSYQDLIDPHRPKSFPFRPGMSTSADIQTRTHVSVLSVPINAVSTREKGTDKSTQAEDKKTDDKGPDASKTTAPSMNDLDVVAFVLQTGDTVKKVKVRTDIQDINYIEVVDGLKEGDQVITGPYSIVNKTLKSGMKVKVVPKEKLFEGKN